MSIKIVEESEDLGKKFRDTFRPYMSEKVTYYAFKNSSAAHDLADAAVEKHEYNNGNIQYVLHSSSALDYGTREYPKRFETIEGLMDFYLHKS